MNHQPTQQDVARIARVNKSTVSRVLSGDGAVATKTRDRVLKVVRELNYTLDPALARIAALRWQKYRQRTGQPLAFVERTRCDRHERHFSGLKDEADPLGYRVERFCVEDFRESASVASVLRARGVKMVVLAGFDTPSSLDGISLSEFSAVQCGSTIPGLNLCSATVDYSSALARVWHLAKQRGKCRIGLVQMTEVHSRYASTMLQGTFRYFFQQVATATMLPRCEIPFSDCSFARGRQQLEDWLEEHKPELVIGDRDAIYRGIKDWSPHRGARPEFVSLSLVDGSGEIAGFEESSREIGRVAVRLLHLKYLSGLSSGSFRTGGFCETRWRAGRSFAVQRSAVSLV